MHLVYLNVHGVEIEIEVDVDNGKDRSITQRKEVVYLKLETDYMSDVEVIHPTPSSEAFQLKMEGLEKEEEDRSTQLPCSKAASPSWSSRFCLENQLPRSICLGHGLVIGCWSVWLTF